MTVLSVEALTPEEAALLDEDLLGLTVRRRLELAASRAGFDGTVFGGAPAPDAVVLKGVHVAQAAWLRSLSEGRVAPPGTKDAFRLSSRSDLRPAERWLLAGLVRDTEGFMSRHVERRISLSVSRLLCRTSITPNAMTVVSGLFGLAGAAFFLDVRPAFELTGALLFLLHSILDGCDGELARLKFQESRFGGILDFWTDNVVHVAVFLCIAIGWSRAIERPWPLYLGASAVLGTILSAGFVYARTMTGPKDGPLFTSVATRPTAVSRVADALARRDFIYLVVVLSAFGKASRFLVLSAVGAPSYFLVLLALAAFERRRAGALARAAT